MKVRVISAAVAIAVAIPFIILGGIFYALGIGIIAILGFKEVIDLKKSHQELPFWPSLLAITAYLLIIYTNFNGDNNIYNAPYMHLIFTSLVLLIPVIFYKDEKYTMKDAFFLIGITLFLGIGFNSFILVRDEGLKTFFYLVSIPISTDTAAYFIGTKFGKKKMCPKISPHKSWEGFYGGLLVGTIIPSALYLIFFKSINIKIILATIILSTMGQLGDLIFSKIKRENGIKDFSNLMPGHGGCLDRVDSTIVIFMTYIYLSSILF